MQKSKAAFKLPKTDAACADLLYSTREQRLKLQREVEALDDVEKAIKEHFIQNLSKKDATGIAGKVARVQLQAKTVPSVEDWDAFYAHVKKTGNFELMQRRVNEGAVRERWENKKEVPGVGRFNTVSVSCTLIK